MVSPALHAGVEELMKKMKAEEILKGLNSYSSFQRDHLSDAIAYKFTDSRTGNKGAYVNEPRGENFGSW